MYIIILLFSLSYSLQFLPHPLEKRISYKTLQANRSTDQTKEQITDENKELIYTMFRKDFEYFGYEK